MRNTMVALFLGMVFLLGGCQSVAPAPGPGIAKVVPPTPLDPKSSPTILSLAAGSACAKYSWANRGRAPAGYIKGMALEYAKVVCSKRPATALGAADTDGLTHYGLKPSLRNTYLLLIGLGMRESSGQHCCGRDMSASFSSSSSAEAGLFQTSWGVRRASPELAKLYDAYNKDRSGCLLDVFKEGVKCGSGDAKNWGDGDGFNWQKLTKECPAFATEYAEIVLRKSGGSNGEFGPIRHKAAEMPSVCGDLLDQVEKVALGTCGGL